MTKRNFLFLLIVLIFSFPSLLFCIQNENDDCEVVHYNIETEIIPLKHFLIAKAKLTIRALRDNIKNIHIFLHRDFTIKNILADIHSLNFSIDPQSPEKLMYSPTALPIQIELPQAMKKNEEQIIEIDYCGEISSPILSVNMITEHLTEIAVYSAWYPIIKGTDSFTYSLEIALPADQTCITDGELVKTNENGTRKKILFKRNESGTDIPVIASDLFKNKVLQSADIRAYIYYTELDETVAEEILRNAITCTKFFTEKFGQPARKGKVVFINSPRSGWAYSRAPLFISSEKQSAPRLKTEEGKISGFRSNAHEIAHFWWMLTDASTTDNWIDEALAEFSALLALEQFYGSTEVSKVLNKYRMDILKLKSPEPILETKRDNKNAYVLFYEKGSYIFIMLKAILGKERLISTLKEFYIKNRDSRTTTTADLLEVFRNENGKNLNGFFEQFLKKNALPDVAVEWACTEKNKATGIIYFKNAELFTFPLELFFTNDSDTAMRTVTITSDENEFKFSLPLKPNELVVDKNNKLLRGNTTVNRK